MAKFEYTLPKEILNGFSEIQKKSPKIFEKMTEAGAKVVERNIRKNLPSELKANASFMRCLKISKTYKTPSDGGINTKVGFWGYFDTKRGEKVAAPLVANAFEYGTSERSTKQGYSRGRIAKKPFLRKSFNKKEIEKAMIAEQDRLLKRYENE